MKTVSVYPRDSEVGSSSYYRILQYFNRMNDVRIRKRIFVPPMLTKAVYNAKGGIKGVAVKLIYHLCIYFTSVFFLILDNISTPDCVVILRSIEPKTFYFPVNYLYSRLLNKVDKCIWDFDDDIFVSNEISLKESKLLQENADVIIVTHEYLASLLPKQIQNRVVLMPTTDGDFHDSELDSVVAKRRIAYAENFRIAWLASSAGLADIESIAPYLDQAAKCLKEEYGKVISLVVICNRELEYNFSYLNVEHVVWTRQRAIEKIMCAHIGIMPLLDSKFSLGKGGFKIVQYMAAGLPSIASAVGYNKKVIDDQLNGYLIGEDMASMWVDRIIQLSTNYDQWEKMSFEAKKKWCTCYNYSENYNVWKHLINE